MCRFAACIALLLSVLTCGPACAQSNTKTLNGKDGVQIAKITPRTNAEIPMPVRNFVYTLELQAKVVTTPTARVVVRFYRYAPDTLQLERLAPPVTRVVKGSQGARWRVESSPISLSDARADQRLYVKASLFDGRGRLVAWSESFNTVSGAVVVTPTAGTATTDRLRALPGTTAPNTALTANTNAEFVVRVRYEVRSSLRGVISVEFGELNDIRLGRPWSVSVIEVSAGTGEVELRRSLPIAPTLRGATLAIAVALRNDPLSGASARLEMQPYPIGE